MRIVLDTDVIVSGLRSPNCASRQLLILLYQGQFTALTNALHLQASIMEELRSVVETEGTTINQFINVAVAEKLAALRTEHYFRERAARANRSDFMEILSRAGSEEPREGDELPENYNSNP